MGKDPQDKVDFPLIMTDGSISETTIPFTINIECKIKIAIIIFLYSLGWEEIAENR
jgi:hypothetical protein